MCVLIDFGFKGTLVCAGLRGIAFVRTGVPREVFDDYGNIES